MMATAALLLSADATGIMRMTPAGPPANPLADESGLVLPDPPQAGDPSQSAPNSAQTSGSQPEKKKSDHLRPESRLDLVRYIDGEFVRVVAPIPAGKKGIHIKVGDNPDQTQKSEHIAILYGGAAINPGDRAQITSLEFKDREIEVGINGGGRGKTSWRDRIHMDVGGMTTSNPDAPVNLNAGATIYLDFDRPLPEMTPDDLKRDLSSLLDFSKEHSAAVQWMDTLPPEIQTAIAQKRPAVGMDHEMVLAALGRPDRKVREREADGTETEDWIYGTPPAKTVFVVFEGDKVTQVEQFPK
ncbi:MAG: hypothetical protein ACRD4Y_14250 [Candidatus Acidiferrales bacterium]